MKTLFDLKYAMRMLHKNPGFSLLTVGIMAMGFALCIYMLSFILSTVLRPLPFDGGERMRVIEAMVDGIGWNGGSMEQYEYHAIRDEAQSFDEMGWYYTGTANLSNGERAARFRGVFTEPGMFAYTGIQPVLGRVFNEREARLGAQPVAVISFHLWQDYFAADADIIGQSVKVNGRQTEIIGVMPEGFKFPVFHDLWLPNREDVNSVAKGQGVGGVIYTKLKPGVSEEEARLEIVAIMQRLEQEYPEVNSGRSAYIATYQSNMMGNGSDGIVGIMVISVLFVMALACFNVGNLLLARANERAKETAIRVALGAPTKRLILQMMWESAIICFLGATFGILVTAWMLELTNAILPNMMPIPVPYWWEMGLQLDLLVYSVIITVLTAVFTGLVPAWRMVKSDFNSVLRDGTRGAIGKRAGLMNRVLVVAEVALSCALLIVSMVLYMLIDQANTADYGANTDHILTARLGIPGEAYSGDGERYRFFRDAVDTAAAIPGVRSVGAGTSLPSFNTGSDNIVPEGMEIIDNTYPRAGAAVMTVETLDTMGMTLLEGRWFDSRDTADSLKVAVITDSAARLFWPGESALGKRYKNLATETPEGLTVVGVVKHIIHGQPYENVKHKPTTYVPMSQNEVRFMTLALKVEGDPNQYRAPLIDALAKVDSEIPAYSIIELNERIAQSTGGMNFLNTNFMIFAVCALFLAASGIYGVLANSTQRRTQEIGVRRAIGATDATVMTMLVKQGARLCLIGLLIGMPLAYLMSSVFVGLVGNNSNNIWFSFVLVPGLIAAVVGLATVMPARRAIAMEPSVALRYE